MRKEYDAFRKQRSVEERAIEKGKEIGEQRGKEIGENMKALAVASRMLASGEPGEKILDYTGIAPEELDKLVASKKN